MCEFEDKFSNFDSLFFGNIKFMLYYAAAGPNLHFYIINRRPNSSNCLIPLSNQLSIKIGWNHVSILCTVVNITHIIRTVSGTISRTNVSIGKWLKLERSMITFFYDSVEKMVPLEYLPEVIVLIFYWECTTVQKVDQGLSK